MTSTIALIFGGRSSEHGISCVTAGAIMQSIDRSRYSIVALGITRSGRMIQVSDDPAEWTLAGGQAPEVPEEGDEVLFPAAVSPEGEGAQFRIVRNGRVEPLASVDLVFPLLHGPYGEDGTIQGALELLDIPYVGSGVLASAQGMDKISTKAALVAAGLKVADGVSFHAMRWKRDHDQILSEITQTLPAPWFVKPSRAGSSMGVSRVTDAAALPEAIEKAIREDSRVLVEAAVLGREVECAVLQGRDGAEPRTTIPGEVRVGDDLEFYDYESKYFGKGTVSIDVPARLTDAQTDSVRDIARRAFTALGLEGLARIDVFVTEDERVIINEVNTMPGFTPFSMYPVLWQNMGLEYSELLTELLELTAAKPRGLR